ncbi:GIY-YIG nuclease family protein [Paenibacillus odorifer]|uniref:GIY-YIG nuclease family protein n=1 Tax=Paenibacillus TaxID=44249 RepID=UPI00096FB551|nr:GIY-YIG nuclease family protein [Paenibacillus odorifer]OME37857.1 hypothetical protein BSK46_14090 [Paenibacillus odorifer]OME42751.1 hypothetical protein BSK58_11420 [Paenibacillus odorifer]
MGKNLNTDMHNEHDWYMKRRVGNHYQKVQVNEITLNGDWMDKIELRTECIQKKSIIPLSSLFLTITKPHFSTTAHRIFHNYDMFQGGIVYCIYKSDSLQYVGKTISFRERMQEHKYTSDFDLMDEAIVIHGRFVPFEEDLDIYELFLINTLKPKNNKKLVYTY